MTRFICASEAVPYGQASLCGKDREIQPKWHWKRCVCGVPYELTSNNSGGLIHQPASKSAYEWYVGGLRSYEPAEGGMARTYSSHGARRTQKRFPVKAQPLQVSGTAIDTTQAVQTSVGFYQPNARGGDTLYKSEVPVRKTLSRPSSATTFREQQYRATELAQPKWREVPFEQYVNQKDRQNIAIRKMQYQNRLFGYN